MSIEFDCLCGEPLKIHESDEEIRQLNRCIKCPRCKHFSGTLVNAEGTIYVRQVPIRKSAKPSWPRKAAGYEERFIYRVGDKFGNSYPLFAYRAMKRQEARHLALLRYEREINDAGT